MNHRLNQQAELVDFRKLGIGLMLVGFIALIIREDVSTFNGVILSSLGAIMWGIGIIKWELTWI